MKPHYPTTIHSNAGTLCTGEPSSRLLAVCKSQWAGGTDPEQDAANGARLAACWNACHGLDPAPPPRAVAALVSAARRVSQYYDEAGRAREPGGAYQGLDDALAPFITAPVSAPVSPPEEPEPARYALLNPGDTMQEGDEHYCPRDMAWLPVVAFRDPFDPEIHRPVRRRLPAPAPVSTDYPDDRRPVWSFEVDGKHVRWCGTLDQWHTDRIAYVDKSEGAWEMHSKHLYRFIEPAGERRPKRTTTIFRAVKQP